ncbi:MAG: 16S rRNA (guanine(527)-N(7))-methyltransferase RsmG [Clostridia bacterium]
MENFKEKLIEKAKNYEIELSLAQAESFEKYKNILVEWNKVMNLTAIVEEEEIIVKHFIDSLMCIKYIKPGDSLIDVGTGAGFPGIPLAIYYGSDVKITLLDSLNKRINFLNEVVKQLNLKNVVTIHARAEELSHDANYRETFDVVISRAVAALNILAEFNVPYLKVGGTALFMKGSSIKEELDNAKKAFKVLSLENINIIEYTLEKEILHTIIEAKKSKKNDNKYPRIFGKIKKEPI